MNIDKIKLYVKSFLGKDIRVLVNLGRNKEESYVGKIEKLYPAVFTVRDGGLVKSYSYSDVMTKHVKLKEI